MDPAVDIGVNASRTAGRIDANPPVCVEARSNHLRARVEGWRIGVAFEVRVNDGGLPIVDRGSRQIFTSVDRWGIGRGRVIPNAVSAAEGIRSTAVRIHELEPLVVERQASAGVQVFLVENR